MSSRILANNENKRITVTLLEKQIGKKINRRVDKLPKTKTFLCEILENVDKYSIRRIRGYCENLSGDNTCINEKKL